MKKLLIPLICLAALVAASLWFLVRRGSTGAPPAETTLAFQIEDFGPGTLLHYADGQTPLRALRWLVPLPGGIQPVQVLTQSDRQRLVLFQNGKLIVNIVVPRPSGVREGFFNFAELRDLIVVPDDVAVLLYRSTDASSGELPLIITMDLASQAPRWVHRAPGERLALGEDSKSGSVFLFGTASVIVRMPLALQKGEKTSATPYRVAAKPIDMPEEIKGPADLLPTGPWSFLLAHAGGLSSYAESKGWQHWPSPLENPLTFTESSPVLARAKGYWWQPFPGRIIQIKADGAPMATFDSAALAPAEPWARDGALLKLRGADPAGNLWFSLATPSTPSSLATPEAPVVGAKGEPEPIQSADRTWKPEGPTGSPSTTQEDWSLYCSQGLERVYRWNPERRTLHGRALPEIWAALALPQGVNRPTGIQDFHPESGRILVESGLTAWLLPLEALPLETVGPADKGQPR